MLLFLTCVFLVSGLLPPLCRFIAAKCLGRLAGRMDKGFVASHIRPCLTGLCEDVDEDVRIYSSKALATC